MKQQRHFYKNISSRKTRYFEANTQASPYYLQFDRNCLKDQRMLYTDYFNSIAVCN